MMTTVIRALANGETEIQDEAGAVVLRVPPGADVQAALDALPKPPVQPIRVIPLVAFINRASDAEKAAVASNSLLLMALIEKVAEGGVPVVNLDSPRVVGMLIAAGVSPARIAELTADGDATEAA
jgi:hypothetical protein